MNNEHVAVKLTETAKGNSFDGCDIYGKVEVAGQDNNFIRTKIYEFKRDNPFWFQLGRIAIIIGLVAGFISIYDVLK